jgi:hypothetical protein
MLTLIDLVNKDSASNSTAKGECKLKWDSKQTPLIL